jgi:hypothetical protein
MHIFGTSEQFVTRKSPISLFSMDQPNILTLLLKFSIFKVDARVEDLKILIVLEKKFVVPKKNTGILD